MTFTLDGTSYTVPASTGQLALTVAPGTHTYVGTVQGWPSASGQIDLPAGQTCFFFARFGRSDSVVDQNGKPLDTSAYQYTLVFAMFWQGPAGNRLPVQAPSAGESALVFENNIAADVTLEVGPGVQYLIPAGGRLELLKLPSPVRFSAGAAWSNWQSGVGGVAQMAGPGQVAALALSADTNVHVQLQSASQQVNLGNVAPWEMRVSNVPVTSLP
jgi:hypothetical protein